MPKRKLSTEDDAGGDEGGRRKVKIALKHKSKHSLDSDEEDSGDEVPDQEQHMDGQEEATISMEGGITITPFNMKEELEEGHFDNEGHYHWKKEKEIKDGWLDNIDWVKVQGRPEDKYKIHKEGVLKGLGDDSSSDSETEEVPFNLNESYKQMMSYMKEKETVLATLRRLGAGKTVSSAERWKRKKAGIVDPSHEDVTKLTSIANEILSKTGNMDIYQITYEKLNALINASNKGSNSKKPDAELDMYSDDFESKEKEKIVVEDKDAEVEADSEANLMWEFKWSQNDDDTVHGPHTTEQMQKWMSDGYFKTGVWVRKVGQEGPFYTSNRIDFELYL